MFDFDVLGISVAADDLTGGGLMALGTVNLNVAVAEVPRGPALTLPPEATVGSALGAMRRRGRGAALIVREQRPIGIVTDRDILAHVAADGQDHPIDVTDLRELPLAAVMAPCPQPLRPTDAVGAVLRRMCASRQWHLPLVCARGLILGAVDVTDLCLWLRDRVTLLSVDAALGTGLEAHRALR